MTDMDFSLFTVLTSMICVHFALLLRAVIIAKSDFSLWWAAFAHKIIAKFNGCTFRWKSPRRSEADDAIRKKMCESQMVHFQSFMLLSEGIILVIELYVALNIACGLRRFHTLAQDLIVVLSHSFFILLRCFPCILSIQTLDYVFSGLMALVSLYVAPVICERAFLGLAGQASSFIVSLASMARLHSPVVIVWNVVHTSVLCAAYALSNDRLAEGAGHLSTHLWLQQSMSPLLTCICVALVERRWEAQFRSDLEAISLRDKQFAGNALLNIFYDVVVELDSELAVTSSWRELSVLLNCGRPLYGIKLEELLPFEQDRELFMVRMRQPRNVQESMAEVMHLRMGNDTRNCLNVELFSFKFGHLQHMIGIRAFNNEGIAEPGLLVGEHPGWQAARPDVLVVAPESPRNPLAILDQVTVVIDSIDPSLPVLGCSDSFRRVVGGNLVLGCSLHSLLDGGHSIQDWFQKVVNSHLTGEVEKAEYENSVVVNLRPQLQPSVRLRGTCRILLDRLEDHDGNAWPLCLAFSDLQRVLLVGRCQERSAQRRSASGQTFSSSGGKAGKRFHTRTKANRRRLVNDLALGKSVSL